MTAFSILNRLDPIVALADLAQGYITGRLTDEQYISAATAFGLSRGEATERCLALDAGSALGKYRRARRDALRACRVYRARKQCESEGTYWYGRMLEKHQVELKLLRQRRYGARA